MTTVFHVRSDKTREIKHNIRWNNEANQVYNVLRSSCRNRDNARKPIQFKRDRTWTGASIIASTAPDLFLQN